MSNFDIIGSSFTRVNKKATNKYYAQESYAKQIETNPGLSFMKGQHEKMHNPIGDSEILFNDKASPINGEDVYFAYLSL